MDRGQLKGRVAVLLSDLGVLAKVPQGRTDHLTDTFATTPEFFQQAVLGRMPPKGSRDWRWCREYAVEGKVPRRKERAPREPRAPRADAEVVDGQVRFRKSFIRQLVAAGRDYARDCRKQLEGPEGGDIAGPAWDMAEAMLSGAGVDPRSPGFQTLKEAAGDYVAEGIQKELK